ncbi:MAG: iron-containing alcohol dehydrogenase, partial [Sphingomonadales bacterium]
VHAIESYLSVNRSLITDSLALGAIKLIVKALPKAYANPADLVAREHMATASLMAGMAFGNAGVGAVHALAYPLGGRFNIAHGVSNFWAWIQANFDPAISWRDLEWVRERWPGPLILKGILDVEDARLAAASGVDAIVVSNHGGRQLDSVSSSISALPSIADAVGDQMAIFMDGGVRSGLDIVKALASGARACLVGRAWAWAVAARGEAGVEHMLQIIHDEMMIAMTLTGSTDVTKLDRSTLA